METHVTTLTDRLPLEAQLRRAANTLRQGGLVAFPTETVYGLGANALDKMAVLKIFAAKGRPADNPLIAHITDFDEVYQLTEQVDERAKKLAKAFWPGPLTMIFTRRKDVPAELSAGMDTVAVRMPSHPAARALISLAGVPVAAPSANLSGRPSPTCGRYVLEDLMGRVDEIVVGDDCKVGIESTVLSFSGKEPVILRPGAVTKEMLEQVIGPVRLHHAATESLKEGEQAASPGMKYKHYAPEAHVILVEGKGFARFVKEKLNETTAAMCFEETAEKLPKNSPVFVYASHSDEQNQGAKVFTLLRDMDKRGFTTVYCEAPEKTGVGLAVYNRLVRAAGFEVITL